METRAVRAPLPEPSRGRQRRASHSAALTFLVLVVAAPLVTTCASPGRGPGTGPISFPGDLPSAFNEVLAAASSCDLAPSGASQDPDGRSALLFLLSDWRSPRPESALVTVRFAVAGGGVEARIEAQPLAKYGMRIPSTGTDSGCKPCTAANQNFELVQFSQGLATGNALRASRCLRERISLVIPAPPPARSEETLPRRRRPRRIKARRGDGRDAGSPARANLQEHRDSVDKWSRQHNLTIFSSVLGGWRSSSCTRLRSGAALPSASSRRAPPSPRHPPAASC